jgi:DNA-binding SARP family transcriptional activator
MMRYAVLGQVELSDGEHVLAVGGPRQVALLAFLLIWRNQAVSTARLSDAVWGEHGAAGSVKRVQVAVTRLRRVLARAGAPTALRTVAGGYLLRVEAEELDAAQFEARLADGRRALDEDDAPRAAELLHGALGLWRGPAFADVPYETYALPEIRRLDELRGAALEARVEADLRLGRHAALVGELDRVLHAEPGRERIAGQLMLALYRCGRQADALDVYQRVRAQLDADLGLQPGPALQAMQRAILEQDPALDLASPAPPAAMAPAEPHRVALPAELRAAAIDPFVGRDDDLRWLAGLHAQPAAGARLALLGGEPGIGKTRLAAQFAQRAHAGGANVLYGRCDEEPLRSVGPFVQALRQWFAGSGPSALPEPLRPFGGELQRLLPELQTRFPGLPAPLALDPEGARARQFDAIAAVIADAARRTPLVLVLDDLHWADHASLLMLRHLVRGADEGRLLIVATYRQTELQTGGPLAALLADLGRERLAQARMLAPLQPDEIARLAGVHAADQATPELCRRVHEQTAGNALYAVELLRDVALAGDAAHAAGAGPPIPAGVRPLVAQRVGRLGPAASRLLAVAALLGGTFELDVLAELVEEDEDAIVDMLDAAARARLVDEIAGTAGGYVFAHALIRQALYEELSATRRALLHRRAAAAIERLRAADLEPHLAALAHHHAQAGPRGDRGAAVRYGERAGRRALDQLAYEQAAAQFRAAAQLLAGDGDDAARGRRCDLVIAQGEAERSAGDPAYRATLLSAARLAQELGDGDRLARAALANNRAIYSSALGVDGERVAVLRAALAADAGGDSPTRAALLALLALELVTADDWRERDAIGAAALAMARRTGDEPTLARVLVQHAVARWQPQTLAALRADLGEAEAIAERLGDPPLVGQSAYFGAHAAMEAGDLAESDRLLARLAAVAGELGQPLMRWYDAVARAKRSAIGGPPDEAERLAFAAQELGGATGQADTLVWFLGQLFVARFLAGRLDAPDPHLPELAGAGAAPFAPGAEITPHRSMPLLVGATSSIVFCETGRLDDARRELDLVLSGGLDDLPTGFAQHAIPALASVACARLRDERGAARLHAILAPHAERFVNTGTSWFGVTAHWLGLLAATLGRADEASARFAAAGRAYAALGAAPWLGRLQQDRRSHT